MAKRRKSKSGINIQLKNPFKRRRKNKDLLWLALFALLVLQAYAETLINVIPYIVLIGFIIIVLIFVSRHLKNEKIKASGIVEIDKMDGHKFEHYLNVLFKSLGYHSIVTKGSGDYGADLVIEKDGKRIVVQAKRYSSNVGIDAVQQVQASIAHYKANEAWVVCNQDYTEAAYNLAKSNGVRLINRDGLIELIHSIK